MLTAGLLILREDRICAILKIIMGGFCGHARHSCVWRKRRWGGIRNTGLRKAVLKFFFTSSSRELAFDVAWHCRVFGLMACDLGSIRTISEFWRENLIFFLANEHKACVRISTNIKVHTRTRKYVHIRSLCLQDRSIRSTKN